MEYIHNMFQDSVGYFNYLVYEILHPRWDNYVYALFFFSLLVWFLEILFPRNKKQVIFRKDFYLDLWYLFFNFFLFNLFVFVAFSNAFESFFKQVLLTVGIELRPIFSLASFSMFIRVLVYFVLIDFIQWNVHRALHTFPFLWQFHKVHHSANEMGFATHFRFHWLETIVYKFVLYLPLAFLTGVSVHEVVFVHYLQILIGHLNHANLNWNYGAFKYFLNQPEMHLWHHAKELPKGKKNGVNFGISLSIWDYIFRTNYVPLKKPEIGLTDEEEIEDTFVGQLLLVKKKKEGK